MRMTLIAVLGVALTAGGCSLSLPGSPGTYSSLGPDIAVAAVPAPEGTQHSALPSNVEDAPATALMPGDPTGPIRESGAGRVNPIASLSASARARDHWETLKPGELKAPAPVVVTGSVSTDGSNKSAATPIAASAAAANNYDREAAMQNLINGGKSAAKRICNGC